MECAAQLSQDQLELLRVNYPTYKFSPTLQVNTDQTILHVEAMIAMRQCWRLTGNRLISVGDWVVSNDCDDVHQVQFEDKFNTKLTSKGCVTTNNVCEHIINDEKISMGPEILRAELS